MITFIAQLALAAFVGHVIYSCYFHPLARYPGPFLARFTNLWRLFIFLGGKHHLVEQELHEKYGHVVRVAPNWLSFSGLKDFEAIYSFNKSIEKDDFYRFGSRNSRMSSIFSTKTDAAHRQRKRKVLGPALASGKIAKYNSIIAKHVDIFFTRVEAESSSQHEARAVAVNIAPLVHRFTVDTMLELIYGPTSIPHPYTDSEFAGDICESLHGLVKMAWSFSLCPSFGWIMNSRLVDALRYISTRNNNGSSTGMSALMASGHSMIFKHAEEAQQAAQPGIVKSWLEVPVDDPNRMTPDEVLAEASNMVIAGPGSTAAIITAALHQLGTNEGRIWQDKIRGYTGALTVPFPLELQAVIKETLRVCVAFPTAFPRVITPGAETVVPNLPAPLPSGTRVSANTYVLGRSREIWGDDADQWLPQRWLGDESHRRGMDAKLVAFSRGSRGCVGKDLAWQVLGNAVLSVVQRWKIVSLGDLRGKSYLEMQNFSSSTFFLSSILPHSATPTLRSITDIKISELSKQRSLFQKQYDEILNAATSASDLRSKARVLLEGVTKLKGHPNDAIDRDDLLTGEPDSYITDGSERAKFVNIRRFLLQSQYDPSVSDRSLKDWVTQLEEEVKFLYLRHKHASFYSNLVTEWLAELEAEGVATSNPEEPAAGFESVGRAEMQEQRATWEQYVFNEAAVDEKAITAYLDGLFTKTALSQQALEDLRKEIRSFGDDLAAEKKWFTVDTLKWVSQALLKSDLLTKEKSAILKEFMRNEAVAQEVADVLNMRLASLDNWSWPAEGISLEMRRQLNGKYRVFMDEDLLDSLLFQYLGLKWAVAFRSAFVSFLHSRAWTSMHQEIPKSERTRRAHFVGRKSNYGHNCVNDHRRSTYQEDYFMTQLPHSENEGVAGYDEDNNSVDDTDKRKSGLDTKHSLLHLLVTESIMHTQIYGRFTAIRSDFKYFGPSLPHTTMLTVLSYFGVSANWLAFFKKFLESPLQFSNDGPGAATQTRRRGIPMSHTLSDCFGEAVLFCMDYAVNQNTDGAYLYRLHDDFWFWGQEETCVKAWTSMTEFAQVMGLEFNEEKTGTTRLVDNKKPSGLSYRAPASEQAQKTDGSDILPSGEIRWGFLKLDAQEGRFVIDQEQVDIHITELQRQLSACKSVFSWAQAWNSYFGRFFANNFAKPAMCFGRSHIDMAISTLSRIERTLFPDSPSGVTDHLRKVITERFDIHDLPDGFFYFPVELGGLELLNPYISLLAMRENIRESPSNRLRRAYIEEEQNYHNAQEFFDNNGPPDSSPYDDDDDPSAFLSLEEYTRHAETYSRPLLEAYKDLIRVPSEKDISQSQRLRGNQLLLGDNISSRNVISGSWSSMSPYWKWAAELYQGEMVKTYGSLAAVNREFMPLGVVQTLKEGKFRWQG
ncbi:cytochrome P450 [Aspergillus avenaceus]|uniref:Cytochrome P450 n=1 Tax=Aspergillus avenaceus TaxID=36643 RepID=A0A5N6TN43_ASPAV|nr:cytochrome P450 [Aspergillus avenaceus]